MAFGPAGGCHSNLGLELCLCEWPLIWLGSPGIQNTCLASGGVGGFLQDMGQVVTVKTFFK